MEMTQTRRVIALLDMPSADSMGMLATVVKTADGALFVSGMGTPNEVPQASLDELIEHHQSLGLDPALDCADLPDPVVALWIGREFSQRAAALGLPVPTLPGLTRAELKAGSILLSSPAEVFTLLEAWTSAVFAMAVRQNLSAIALLMIQVLPDHALTRAALWYTADETGRAHELAWFLRLDRDVGKKNTAAALEQEFRAACAQVLGAAPADTSLPKSGGT
jgi:hypothetical protein